MVWIDYLFYAFAFVCLLQVVFYFLFLKNFALEKPSKPKHKNIAVSVLICAKNEAENLTRFLPSILEQEYPNFEVVLIDDDSSDDTLEIMESYAEKHTNIKLVKVKNVEAFWSNKKYALTLGIKAASNDFLLFTDADCKPVSKDWIRHMSSHFSNEKTLVLGYGAYEKTKGSLLNKLIRFETLFTAIQYFSFTKSGMPYMAVGRNLAYRKDLFFNARGFMNHLHVRSGDDDLFVNEVATSKNTALCFSPESVTVSLPKKTYKEWIAQKRRHISTAHYYKFWHQVILTLFFASQLLFWLFLIFLIVLGFSWKIMLSMIGIRFFLVGLVFFYASKKLNEKDVFYLFPFYEVCLIGVQLHIFIRNLFSKPVTWK